jgi:hypothetical protein
MFNIKTNVSQNKCKLHHILNPLCLIQLNHYLCHLGGNFQNVRQDKCLWLECIPQKDKEWVTRMNADNIYCGENIFVGNVMMYLSKVFALQINQFSMIINCGWVIPLLNRYVVEKTTLIMSSFETIRWHTTYYTTPKEVSFQPSTSPACCD